MDDSVNLNYAQLKHSRPTTDAMCGLLYHFRHNETTHFPSKDELRMAMIAFDELPEEERRNYLEMTARMYGLAVVALDTEKAGG